MTTIKFKGKRIDNGEWVYGYLFTVDIDGKNRFFIIPFSSYCGKEVTMGNLQVEIKKETLCQFTGLIDKNNLEVYEGDIVYDTYQHLIVMFGKTKGVQGFALFENITDKNGVCCFTDYMSCVIGNVFDNPELLSIPTAVL